MKTIKCPRCGSTEWEMEADTRESVTYQLDMERRVFTDTLRETDEITPTDWFCLSCAEPADKTVSAELFDQFLGSGGEQWQMIEEDEWSTHEGLADAEDSKPRGEFDGAHKGCGVTIPHSHGA